MISKPLFFAAIVCTGALAVGGVMYQRSRAEVAALRAQVGSPVAPAPRSPSLGAVQVAAAAPAVPAAPAAEESSGEPSLADQLLKADTLAEALRLTVPIMEDTTNRHSEGMLLLGLWGIRHIKWADVAVSKNETSFAKVMKDSDSARGKRMCLPGGLIEITKDGRTGLYSGLLQGFYGNGVVSYIAIGDTGDLVQGSEAKFCGVVTGRFTYGNAGGGTTHAIGMVGMFDLPENNPTKRRRGAARDDDE